eukprot:6158-Heterococcus_DN1.PRE.1
MFHRSALHAASKAVVLQSAMQMQLPRSTQIDALNQRCTEQHLRGVLCAVACQLLAYKLLPALSRSLHRATRSVKPVATLLLLLHPVEPAAVLLLLLSLLLLLLLLLLAQSPVLPHTANKNSLGSAAKMSRHNRRKGLGIAAL